MSPYRRAERPTRKEASHAMAQTSDRGMRATEWSAVSEELATSESAAVVVASDPGICSGKPGSKDQGYVYIRRDEADGRRRWSRLEDT